MCIMIRRPQSDSTSAAERLKHILNREIMKHKSISAATANQSEQATIRKANQSEHRNMNVCQPHVHIRVFTCPCFLIECLQLSVLLCKTQGQYNVILNLQTKLALRKCQPRGLIEAHYDAARDSTRNGLDSAQKWRAAANTCAVRDSTRYGRKHAGSKAKSQAPSLLGSGTKPRLWEGQIALDNVLVRSFTHTHVLIHSLTHSQVLKRHDATHKTYEKQRDDKTHGTNSDAHHACMRAWYACAHPHRALTHTHTRRKMFKCYAQLTRHKHTYSAYAMSL